jgi:phage tail-like protein
MASPSALISRKSRISDYLSTLHFHLIDVSFKIPAVFNLSYGFRYCSGPEITVDVKEVKEGTYEYKKSVVHGATAGPITLHQGAQIFNSDFYDWVRMAVKGTQAYRRNFMLIQFTDVSPFGVGAQGTGKLGGPGFGSNNLGNLVNAVVPLNDLISRVPGRSWMLNDCIPTHYKAATDFDPLSADISIMELTLQPQSIEEFSLGV